MKKLTGIIAAAAILFGLGLFAAPRASAMEVWVGGGLWDFGVNYNLWGQESQYSNYYHPNYHRSTVRQNGYYYYSSGTYYYGGKWWKSHYSWSYAQAPYQAAWERRSYYDYLTW